MNDSCYETVNSIGISSATKVVRGFAQLQDSVVVIMLFRELNHGQLPDSCVILSTVVLKF